MFDWAKVLLTLVQLISSVVTWLKTQELISEGKSLEIADELRKQADSIAVAKEVTVAAEKIHAADPTDSAFDQDFFRKE